MPTGPRFRCESRHLVAGVIATAGLSAAGSVAAANPLSLWNLTVFENLTTSQEVEGRTQVGGNISGGSAQFGTMLLPRPSFLGTDVLRVGGNNLLGNTQIEAGNHRLGGTASGNLNFNGGGSLVSDAGTAALINADRVTLTGASGFLQSLAPTGGITLPSGQPAGVTINPVFVGNVAVINLPSGNSLLSSGLVQQIDINTSSLTAARSIIINVGGTSVSANAANFVGAFNTDFVRARVLWNFYQATTLTFDRQFNGAVLAPLAHLTNSTVIAGSVAVRSFTQNGEVHLPGYVGLVPTPSAAGLVALGGLVAARRRRA